MVVFRYYVARLTLVFFCQVVVVFFLFSVHFVLHVYVMTVEKRLITTVPTSFRIHTNYTITAHSRYTVPVWAIVSYTKN